MPTLDCIISWMAVVAAAFPLLSGPQGRVLAQASFGVAVTGHSSRTAVACFLANLLDQDPNTVRQRLREWTYAAPHKRGRQRQSLTVSACWVPFVRWLLAQWQSPDRRVCLALDATTLGQRFTVLAVGLVVRGTAIPIAWQVLPATEPGAWAPHWCRLLDHLDGAFPPDWQVVVMADRGLYAKWLYEAIQAHGWHPFLRITAQGTARAPGQQRFHRLRHWLPERGCFWAGPVTVFKSAPARLSCTLLACWEPGYAKPWLVVTDLPDTACTVLWYGLRGWIEQMFKDFKGGGWHWQDTHTTDPERAGRWWLVLAVATARVILLGVEQEAQPVEAQPGEAQPMLAGDEAGVLVEGQPTTAGDEPSLAVRAVRVVLPARTRRTISCFLRGRCRLLALLIRGEPVPIGCLPPAPWPDSRQPAAPIATETTGAWQGLLVIPEAAVA